MTQHNDRSQFLLLVALVGVAGALAVILLGATHGYAQAPKAAPKATFAGSEACSECHSEVREQALKSPHGLAMTAAEREGRGHLCEGCHGPGSLHINEPSAETAAALKVSARTGEGCLQCHDKTVSRTDWRRSPHHRAGTDCLACHGEALTPVVLLNSTNRPACDTTKTAVAKTPAEPAPFNHAAFTRTPTSAACLTCHPALNAELSMPTHHPVKEGRIGCSDCHDPHKPMTAREKREVCITCHAEQHGPYRFVHTSAKGRLTDGCLDCHRPHGSPNQKLVKFTNRGLCLQCHANQAMHFSGRNCLDCHRAVHGSNSSRLLFTE